MKAAPARDLATPWPAVRARMAPILDEPGRGPARNALHSRMARDLALDLLREAGVAVDEIGRGPEGQPLWPQGWAGSLAHTQGAAVAVVAPLAGCAGLGIDVEPDRRLPEDAASLVLRPEETPAVTQRLAFFCAKECVHKAIFPATGAWLDFQDVRILFDADEAHFHPEPATDKAVAAFAGRRFEGILRRDGGHVVAILRMA